jgi:hypothetical protein
MAYSVSRLLNLVNPVSVALMKIKLLRRWHQSVKGVIGLEARVMW